MATKPVITCLFATALLALSGCSGDTVSKAEQAKLFGYDDCRVMLDAAFKKSLIVEARVTKLCTCMTINLNKALSPEQSAATKAVFKKASETRDLKTAILSESSLSGDELQSYKNTVEQTFSTCEKKLQG